MKRHGRRWVCDCAWALGLTMLGLIHVCNGANPYRFQDDFSGYTDGSDGAPHWSTNWVESEIRAAAFLFRSPRPVFAIPSGAPTGRRVVVETVVTVRIGLTGPGYKFAGPVVFGGSSKNYWILCLTGGPGAKPTEFSRSVQLAECRQGRWMAQEDLSATKVTGSGKWQLRRPYRMRIEMDPEGVRGTVTELDGTHVWGGGYLFDAPAVKQGQPAIMSQSYESAFSHVQMDVGEIVRKDLRIKWPSEWTVFTNVDADSIDLTAISALPKTLPGAAGAVSAQTLSLAGSRIHFTSLAGGSKTRAAAIAFAEITSDGPGMVRVGAAADWWMEWLVNGKVVYSTLKDGNKKNTYTVNDHVFELPLERGRNLIAVKVLSGSKGWQLVCGLPPPAELTPERQATWEVYELENDLRSLRARGVPVPALEQRFRDLKKQAATPGFRINDGWRQAVDALYADVYTGFQCVTLRRQLAEIANVAALTGSTVAESSRYVELQALCATVCKALEEDQLESVRAGLAQAERHLVALWEQQDRLRVAREGVSRSSYGRFGWFTGGATTWVAGDGLLANQAIDGGLVRSYVRDATEFKTRWQLGFGATGRRSGSLDAELAAVPRQGQAKIRDFLVAHAPGVYYSASSSEHATVTDINWVCKRFAFKQDYFVTMSLPCPALLLETPHSSVLLKDAGISRYSHLGFLDDSHSARVPTHADKSVLYDREVDGALGRNWVLLWAATNDDQDLMGHRGSVPLQLIFQHKPSRISRNSNDEIEVTFPKDAGAVWLNTPCGTRLHSTTGWGKAMPTDAISRCAFWARAVLAFPVDCKEVFWLSTDKKTVTIRNRYVYRRFETEWNSVPLEIAPLPPLLAFGLEHGHDGQVDGTLETFNYPTLYGHLKGVRGSEITYSLPVPPVHRLGVVRNTAAHPEKMRLLNEAVRDANDFTHGRLAKGSLKHWSFMYTVSYNEGMQAWAYLNPANRSALDHAPELAEVTFNRRNSLLWRAKVEPYSGRKYFYSYSLGRKTIDEEGNGSDVGWGIGLYLRGLDLMAAYLGRWQLIRDHWGGEHYLDPDEASADGASLTIANLVSYFDTLHDWAWMDSGSNQFGANGPVVDCAQATYAGYAALVRMADALGKTPTADRGRYFLAKSCLSLVYRQAFNSYAQEQGLIGPDDHIAGFRESSVPDHNDHFGNSMLGKAKAKHTGEYQGSQFCNLSTACTEDGVIFFPYFKYAFKELRHYEYVVDQHYWPHRYEGALKRHSFIGMYYRLLNGASASTLLDRIANVWGNQWWSRRNYAFVMGPALSAGCPLTLSRWDPLPFPEGTFDPDAKTVSLAFGPTPNSYTVVCLSTMRPRDIRLNGSPLVGAWRYDARTHVLELDIGKQRDAAVSIRYDHIVPDRFQPIPLPRPRDSAAGD